MSGRNPSQSCPSRVQQARPSTDSTNPQNTGGHVPCSQTTPTTSSALIPTRTRTAPPSLPQIPQSCRDRPRQPLTNAATVGCRFDERTPRKASVGDEGTGSYGAGLAAFLHTEGELVLEVDRADLPLVATAGSPTSSTLSVPHERHSLASISRSLVNAVSERHCACCWRPVIARLGQSVPRSRC